MTLYAINSLFQLFPKFLAFDAHPVNGYKGKARINDFSLI